MKTIPYRINEKKHLAIKKEIGKKASELINENNTIIIDSGSTTYELSKNLKNFNSLTVITNALNVAAILAEYKNINVIVPGCMLKKNSLSLVGSRAERRLKIIFVINYFSVLMD